MCVYVLCVCVCVCVCAVELLLFKFPFLHVLLSPLPPVTVNVGYISVHAKLCKTEDCTRILLLYLSHIHVYVCDTL